MSRHDQRSSATAVAGVEFTARPVAMDDSSAPDAQADQRTAWREAITTFARPFRRETNKSVHERVAKAVAAGMLPGPVPHLATLWAWLKPDRQADRHAARAALAAAAATAALDPTGRRPGAAALADLAAPDRHATHAQLIAHIAALDVLADSHRRELEELAAYDPDLARRHKQEGRLTQKALSAETNKRHGPWLDKHLWVRIRMLRTLARDYEDKRIAAHRDRAQAAVSRHGIAATRYVGAPASVSRIPTVAPTTGVTANLDQDALALYRADDTEETSAWSDDLGSQSQGALGAVIGYAASNKQREDAAVRLDLLAPVLNGIMTAEACATAWRAVFRGETPKDAAVWLSPPADEYQITYRYLSARALREWCAKVREGRARADAEGRPHADLEALVHRQPDRVRTPRAVTLQQVREVCAAFTDNPAFSAALVAEQLRSRYGITVSDRTIQRIIAQRLTEVDRGTARGGVAADDMLFRFRLIREAPHPNRAWIMDHSFFRLEERDAAHPEWMDGVEHGHRDIDLQFECARDVESVGMVPGRRRITKVTMTVILDACTRRVLAIRLWDGAPNTQTTLLALRDAMERFGTPEILYTDNGSDLTAKAVRDALRLAGIKHVLSKPYCPEGRGKVERVIRTIKDRILVTLPGHRSGRHVATADEALLTLQEAESRVWQRVEEWINGKTHGETGRIPRVHYDETIHTRGAIGRPPLPDALIPLLCVRADAVVDEVGAYGNGRRYVGPGLLSLPIGAKVALFSDPYRPRFAWVGVRDERGVLRNNGLVKSYGGADPAPDIADWNALVAQWTDERDREVAQRRAARRAQDDHEARDRAGDAAGAQLAREVVDELQRIQTGATQLALPAGSPAPEDVGTTAGTNARGAVRIRNAGSDEVGGAVCELDSPAGRHMSPVDAAAMADAASEVSAIVTSHVLPPAQPAVPVRSSRGRGSERNTGYVMPWD